MTRNGKPFPAIAGATLLENMGRKGGWKVRRLFFDSIQKKRHPKAPRVRPEH